jgi:hypothetical protein
MEMHTRPNPNRNKNRRGAHSYLTSDEARVRIKPMKATAALKGNRNIIVEERTTVSLF